jgi:hypothetical protein
MNTVEYVSVFTGASPLHTQNRRNDWMTLEMAGVFRLDIPFTLIYCTVENWVHHLRVREQ